MRNFFWCAVFLFSAFFSSAQPSVGKIAITINNEQNLPVENATVELLRAKDSALIKTSITSKWGVAEFESIAAGSYVARISAIGFVTRLTNAIAVSENNLIVSVPAVTMASKPASQMQEVTITAKKPFIQKLNDRIVVNVENSSVNAGSTALDVLERSPGITVDQNDAIALRGKSGVIIMVDGKPSPMTGAELANYLRNLPSNALDRIEIITNPSAKYYAAGNSGIIDLKMKKDQRLGTNGTFTAGYGQGIYPKANTGVSLNHRNKSVNVFGNYSYSYRQNVNHLFINRNFYSNGILYGADDKDNMGVMFSNSNTARVGADFFPSKKTIIGFVVNSNFNALDRTANNSSLKRDVKYNPLARFFSLATNDDHFSNAVGNLNFKHSFNTEGKELTADVDFGIFNSKSITRTATSYLNLNGSQTKDDDILDGDQTGKLKLRTGKIDYTNPFRKGEKFEAGVKTSYVSSDNDAKFYNVLPTGAINDAGKTNHFLYKEYNQAGYLNYAKEFNKVSMQLGLRGEYTALETHQVKGNTSFDRSYFELFPSAFFTYKLKEDKAIGLSVSRRIDRPGYFQLNPFLFQIDATIYSTGAPLLKPQMTWSSEMSYTLKNLNFTLGYSHTTDPQSTVLSKILDVIPNFEIKQGQDSNITVQIPVNLTSSDYVGFTASTPITITKWWNMVNNVNIYYNHFNGNIGGSNLDNGSPSMNIKTNNSFPLKKGWSAELNATLNTRSRYNYAAMEPQWGVSVGGQKTLLKGKGTIRMNVTDIFWTNLPKSTVTYPGSYVENWHAQRETRVANLSFSYRFGNSKVAQARKRTTASEEERQRAGGN